MDTVGTSMVATVTFTIATIGVEALTDLKGEEESVVGRERGGEGGGSNLGRWHPI